MKNIIFFIAVVIANNSNTYCQSSDLSFSDATYTIKVDYTKTIGELIAACNFGYFDSYINDANFPLVIKSTDSVKEVSAKLVNFNREDWISSDEVITKMSQAGYRPATVFELVSFAEKYYRKAEKKFIVIALGSICGVYPESCAPGLHFNEGLCQLDLFSDAMQTPLWPTLAFSFLAICK